MDESALEAELQAAGYTKIETKTLEPRPANVAHQHPYAIRGFVLSGSFVVAQNEQPISYKPGQAFDVASGQLHTEAIGPEGSRILVGRKY